MSLKALWHWPSRSFRQPAMASRTIVLSSDFLLFSCGQRPRSVLLRYTPAWLFYFG